MIKRLSVTFLLALLLSSCDSERVFEGDIDFENGVWQMDSKPIFEFDIEDGSPKNLVIKLRNDLNFKFQNCYVNFKLFNSQGEILESGLVNLQLFDKKTGKPMGKGNSVYQFKQNILSEYRFNIPGQYKVEFTQYMRTSELGGTYSVGLRIENVE